MEQIRQSSQNMLCKCWNIGLVSQYVDLWHQRVALPDSQFDVVFEVSLKHQLDPVEVPFVTDLDDLDETLNYNARLMPALLVVNLPPHSFVGLVFCVPDYSRVGSLAVFWKEKERVTSEWKPHMLLEDAGTYVMICTWQRVRVRSSVMFIDITPACRCWFWCWSPSRKAIVHNK